jgi:hypothetical protein
MATVATAGIVGRSGSDRPGPKSSEGAPPGQGRDQQGGS